MDEAGFALFDTAIGRCAIAWRAAGITGVQLPEPSDAAAARRLRRRFPGLAPAAPPPAIEAAIARIAAFLAGAGDDFASLALDESGVGDFDRAVYRAAQAIPAGATSTYGAIAAGLGDPALARAVGQALGRNPWPIVVPCHRVTGADGRMGGFSAPGGRATKLKLLEIEGALAAESLPLFAAPDRSS
jgi:methylated-DNA-[protein]-cysteine S-methyltransferase